jgi:hypothetical protein
MVPAPSCILICSMLTAESFSCISRFGTDAWQVHKSAAWPHPKIVASVGAAKEREQDHSAGHESMTGQGFRSTVDPSDKYESKINLMPEVNNFARWVLNNRDAPTGYEDETFGLWLPGTDPRKLIEVKLQGAAERHQSVLSPQETTVSQVANGNADSSCDTAMDMDVDMDEGSDSGPLFAAVLEATEAVDKDAVEQPELEDMKVLQEVVDFCKCPCHGRIDIDGSVTSGSWLLTAVYFYFCYSSFGHPSARLCKSFPIRSGGRFHVDSSASAMGRPGQQQGNDQ